MEKRSIFRHQQVSLFLNQIHLLRRTFSLKKLLFLKPQIKVSKRELWKPVHDVMVGMPIFNIQSLFRVSVG